MTFWLALFSHLIRSLQSEQNGKYQGLVAEPTPWSCGSLAAAVVLALAGFETEPRFAAASESDAAALQDLAFYFQTRGIKAVVCSLNREQVLLFFRRFANRPLLAQGIPGQGGFAALLGFVEGFLMRQIRPQGSGPSLRRTFLLVSAVLLCTFPNWKPCPRWPKFWHAQSGG